MRPSPLARLRAVPLSSIPPTALRLPPKPAPSPPPRDAPVGLSVERMVARLKSKGVEVPPNLRVVEFVNKRKEYEGVKRGHRDLLRRLRREA
ncbi:hypothetical protein JCM10207_000822 [Rhodosporidiobolus poonsookiae]